MVESNTSAKYKDAKLKSVDVLTTNDVLCGRGVTINGNPGNVKFRSLVGANKELYVTGSRKEKMKISRSIVEAVRSMSPPGRFLERDVLPGFYNDIGDRKAIEKTSQALRDGAQHLRSILDREFKDPAFPTAVFESNAPKKDSSSKKVVRAKKTIAKHKNSSVEITNGDHAKNSSRMLSRHVANHDTIDQNKRMTRLEHSSSPRDTGSFYSRMTSAIPLRSYSEFPGNEAGNQYYHLRHRLPVDQRRHFPYHFPVASQPRHAGDDVGHGGMHQPVPSINCHRNLHHQPTSHHQQRARGYMRSTNISNAPRNRDFERIQSWPHSIRHPRPYLDFSDVSEVPLSPLAFLPPRAVEFQKTYKRNGVPDFVSPHLGPENTLWDDQHQYGTLIFKPHPHLPLPSTSDQGSDALRITPAVSSQDESLACAQPCSIEDESAQRLEDDMLKCLGSDDFDAISEDLMRQPIAHVGTDDLQSLYIPD